MRRSNHLWCCMFLAACLCLAAGCKKGMPDDVIRPEQMEEILHDFHVAKAMSDELPYTEKYKQTLYLDYVLEKHRIGRADFDSSMVWYSRHAGDLAKIYEKVSKRLETEYNGVTRLIALRDNKPQETLAGDTVDIWYGNRLYLLSRSPMNNRVTFHIPADDNFRPGDDFTWYIAHAAFPKAESDTAVAAFFAHYKNDSILSCIRRLAGTAFDSLTIRCDSAYELEELRGFIYFPGKEDRLMLIDRLSLMRYHPENAPQAKGARPVPVKR